MPYSVVAKKRNGYPGFNRSGILFSSDQPTYLTEEEMTDAILEEPMLIVTEIDEIPGNEEEPEQEEGAGDSDQCGFIKENGERCKRNAADGSGFCKQHQPKE